MTIISATLLLILIFDPIGNIPTFVALLSRVEKQRRRRVLIRELLIALIALIVFLCAGHHFLRVLNIDQEALSLAGGIILFLIALRMIFPQKGGIFGEDTTDEPYLVPLAIPLIAGPSAMATILIFMQDNPEQWFKWTAAVFIAWLTTSVVLFFSEYLCRIISRRTLMAIERLFGMILTVIAVQMVLKGIRAFVEHIA